MKKRDLQGRYSRHNYKKTFLPTVLLALLLTAIVGYIMYSINGAVENAVALDYEQVVEIDIRDNVQKLTDNLAEKIRQVEETNQVLIRAEEALAKAQALYDNAVEEQNMAVDALNLYQNIRGN